MREVRAWSRSAGASPPPSGGFGKGVEVFHSPVAGGRGAAAALEFEVLGNGPAVVFLAHALARIYPHVVKEHLGLGGGAETKRMGVMVCLLRPWAGRR